MHSQPNRLPNLFPVGTRYVVQGRRSARGRLDVSSRYLEFPDGSHIDLPLEAPPRSNRRRSAGRTRRRK